MNDHESPEHEDRLRARLSDEAAAERPEFSAALHERIMESVRQSPQAAAAPIRGWRRIAPKILIAASAVAATVVLALWFAQSADERSRAERPAPPPAPREVSPESRPEPAIGPPGVDESSLAVAPTPDADGLTALVDATFAGSQWAYLDHDARLAADMVLSHFPFEFPETELP